MRKSEMSAWQLESRNSFVNRLIAKGWDVRGWEILFDDDHNLTPEAQAEYQNAFFQMRLNYFLAHGYVLLEAAARTEELAFIIRLYPAGNLSDVIEKIVNSQDNLSHENFSTLVENLKPLCRRILLEKGNELIEIT